MTLRSSSSSSRATLVLVLLAIAGVACSSRVPVGTERTADDELRRGGKPAPKDPTGPAGPSSPQRDAGGTPMTPEAPTTCAELTAGQCDLIPGCRECGPTEFCATPCIQSLAQGCSTTDPVECGRREHCQVCSPAEDCICKPKPCQDLSETTCESVPGCALCPPTAFCSSMCISAQ